MTSGPRQRPAPFPPRAAEVVLENWPGRTAMRFAPAPGRAGALAVELHGSGLDPLRQYRMSGLADLLLAHDVAVLLPQAATPFQLMPQVASGFAWEVPGAPFPGQTELKDAEANDAGYITELVKTSREELQCGDAPLFLAGYSGGARFASSLLTSSPLAFTAAALVAGLRPAEHAERPPPPTIAFHGVEDTINPFAGGLDARWDIGVEEAGRRYARSQGCLPSRQDFQISGATLHAYHLPDGDRALSMYAVAGAAHAWPGTRDEDNLKLFGPAGNGLDASALIADFFVWRLNAAHARGGRAENNGAAQ